MEDIELNIHVIDVKCIGNLSLIIKKETKSKEIEP